MSEPKVLDLFAGIGGFTLGLERAGFETVAFCEIEKYPQQVLAKHWPGVPIYEDVRELTAARLSRDGVESINVITGGWPCQDMSNAGKKAGIGENTRSGLWSECARLLGEIRPDYAIFENVTALLSGDNGRWFQRVLFDISEVGYDAEWHCIPASELGAHHHRDRVWIVAHPNSTPLQRGGLSSGVRVKHTDIECRSTRRDAIENVADPRSERQQGQGQYVQPLLAEALKKWQTINAESGCISGIWEAEPDMGRVANGIPQSSHRLKGLGNAVVPQIPELIGRAIMEYA